MTPRRRRVIPSDERPVAHFDLVFRSEYRLPLDRDLHEDDIIEPINATIQAWSLDDDTKAAQAGEISAYRVRSGVAADEGINPFDGCDAASQDLLEYAEAVLDPTTGALREELSHDAGVHGDILILHKVCVLPAYRGRDLGLAAAHRLIAFHASGLVVCRPQPLQHVLAQQPEFLTRFLDENREMEYQRFGSSRAVAKAKLQRYWARIGFSPLPGGEFYVLNANGELPNIPVKPSGARRVRRRGY